MNVNLDTFRQFFAPTDGDRTPLHMRGMENFDYISYFARAHAKARSDEERERYPYGIVTLHYVCHLNSTGKPYPRWLKAELASYCVRLLQGEEWEAVLELPWTFATEPPPLSRAQHKYLLGMKVHRLLRHNVAGQEPLVKDVIAMVAEQNHVSEKTVEAAWTAYRKKPAFPIAPKTPKK